MKNWNEKLDRTVDGIGWGLFIILISVLFLAQNQGWLNGGWWEYFAIGIGCIFVIGFLARYFAGDENRGKATGGLLIGIALIYVGMAFLNGFGDWWPLALIPIGISCLFKAFSGAKSEYHSPQIHNGM
jgi:peptidoglycan/LPS O-acetylase OafA/YrhL